MHKKFLRTALTLFGCAIMSLILNATTWGMEDEPPFEAVITIKAHYALVKKYPETWKDLSPTLPTYKGVEHGFHYTQMLNYLKQNSYQDLRPEYESIRSVSEWGDENNWCFACRRAHADLYKWEKNQHTQLENTIRVDARPRHNHQEIHVDPFTIGQLLRGIGSCLLSIFTCGRGRC